jgi:hypothetical protein
MVDEKKIGYGNPPKGAVRPMRTSLSGLPNAGTYAEQS